MYYFKYNPKLKSRRPLILILPLLFILSASFAQSKFTQGKIVYTIQVNNKGTLPTQIVRDLEQGKLIYHFKNQWFRSDLVLKKSTHINIHNSQNQTGLSLIKSNSGRNYLIKMSSKELQKEAQKYEGMHFSFEKDTKKIAGYNCHKTIGKLKDGNQFVVYYTKKLQPVYDNYDPRFEGIDGIPLQFQFNIKRANATLTMTATKVNQGFQPSELFKTPTSGYRELTYQQLKQLRKRK